MNDTIYRQAAIEALEEPCKVTDTWTDEFAVGERVQWEKDLKALNSLPPAQPERKKGRWIEKEADGDHYVYCSECGDEYIENEFRLDSWVMTYFRFCPNCGADMRAGR